VWAPALCGPPGTVGSPAAAAQVPHRGGVSSSRERREALRAVLAAWAPGLLGAEQLEAYWVGTTGAPAWQHTWRHFGHQSEGALTQEGC
jgi:hypothetical protein